MMSIRYSLLLSILVLHTFFFATPSPLPDNSYPTPKLLVLIIASDDYPVYGELQKLWRSYMHYDKDHVEAYFIRGNDALETTHAFQEDVLWTKTPENLIPGIVNKTILSLEALMPRIKNHEFDYVLRTNLSSFYVFPRLLAFLRTCPTKGFYCGSNIGVEGIGSGCGFLMSPDVAQMLVDHKQEIYDDETSFDDVVIGAHLPRMSSEELLGMNLPGAHFFLGENVLGVPCL